MGLFAVVVVVLFGQKHKGMAVIPKEVLEHRQRADPAGREERKVTEHYKPTVPGAQTTSKTC